MNLSDAAQLREQWGYKPCNHPLIEAETEAGHPSMNYVCTTCGKVGVGDMWNTPTEHNDSPAERTTMNTQMPDIPERTRRPSRDQKDPRRQSKIRTLSRHRRYRHNRTKRQVPGPGRRNNRLDSNLIPNGVPGLPLLPVCYKVFSSARLSACECCAALSGLLTASPVFAWDRRRQRHSAAGR